MTTYTDVVFDLPCGSPSKAFEIGPRDSTAQATSNACQAPVRRSDKPLKPRRRLAVACEAASLDTAANLAAAWLLDHVVANILSTDRC